MVHRPSRLFAILAIGTLLASNLIGDLASRAEGSKLRETPIVKAVQGARPAVVNIRGEKVVMESSDGLDSGRRVNGMGTGVIIDPRGYILTNLHVVDGVRDIKVTRSIDDKQVAQHTAKLVASDAHTDLAVIKIECSDPLPTITIGTSTDLMTGEPVIAIGNAYGYEFTVTRGIISSLHRPVQVSDAQYYNDLIQTDASINPGNSGGPLLNIDGEMIGINVAVRAGAQGIGFAIPVDHALSVVADILKTVNEEAVWHGMREKQNDIIKVSTAPGDAPEYGPGDGYVIGEIEPDSPAGRGGLQPGDVIAEIDGLPIVRRLDFQRALLEKEPGSELQLTVVREDRQIAIDLKLDKSPELSVFRNHPVMTAGSEASHHPSWTMLGMKLREIPQDQFKQRYNTKHRGGLVVLEVKPGSPAQRQGIRPGDVLVGMHVWETISLDNVSYILKRNDLATINPVKFYIVRNNEVLYGYIPLSIQTASR